jgi:hypothetical protein
MREPDEGYSRNLSFYTKLLLFINTMIIFTPEKEVMMLVFNIVTKK